MANSGSPGQVRDYRVHEGVAQVGLGGVALLVGGFRPIEKYERQNGFIFPNFRGENKKYSSCHHPA